MITSSAIIAGICVGSICLTALAANATDHRDGPIITNFSGNASPASSGTFEAAQAQGASQAPGHEEKIEVESFSWGQTSGTPPGAEGGMVGAAHSQAASQKGAEDQYDSISAARFSITIDGAEVQDKPLTVEATISAVQPRAAMPETIEVKPAGPDAKASSLGALGSLQSLGSMSDLFASSRGGDQGPSFAARPNALGDGSVRPPSVDQLSAADPVAVQPGAVRSTSPKLATPIVQGVPIGSSQPARPTGPSARPNVQPQLNALMPGAKAGAAAVPNAALRRN